MSSSATVSPSDLTTRLKIVNVLPTIAITLVVAVVILAGAPYSAPSKQTFQENVRDLWPGGLALLSVVVTMASVALQPFEMSMIRLLEGYWPTWGPLGSAQRVAIWMQKRQRDTLRYIDGASEVRPSPFGSGAAFQLEQWPEDDADILPMTLGNRLRAMERRAARGYGMDAVISFPRLYLVLPASALTALNELRNQLDASVRFCILSAIGATATAGLLAGYSWWLLLPTGLLLFSLASYRAAVVAAVNYGNLVEAAFSVYHVRILDQTGVKRPPDTVTLRAAHETLERLQKGIGEGSVRYANKSE